MKVSRRLFATAAGAVLAALIGGAALAQTAAPLVIFDGDLAYGWQSWSWARIETGVTVGDQTALKVEGDPWSALALHHDAFSTDGYSKLTFLINGGEAGNQSIRVLALADGKPLDAKTFRVQPKAGVWTKVEVPLSEIDASGKYIDGVWLQGGGESYKAYYVTKIQLEP